MNIYLNAKTFDELRTAVDELINELQEAEKDCPLLVDRESLHKRSNQLIELARFCDRVKNAALHGRVIKGQVEEDTFYTKLVWTAKQISELRYQVDGILRHGDILSNDEEHELALDLACAVDAIDQALNGRSSEDVYMHHEKKPK